MNLLISAAGPLDGQIGGGQVYVQNLVAELRRRGRRVTVVSADRWARGAGHACVDWRQWNGVPVAGVSYDESAVRGGEAWSERARPLVDALRRVVDEVRPDVIHLNGMKPALVAVAQERSIPHVVTAHHGGVACPTGALLRYDGSICRLPMDEAACASCYCRQLRGGATRLGRSLAMVPPWAYRPVGRALDLVANPTYVGRAAKYPWLVECQIAGKRYAVHEAQRWIAPSRAMAEVLLRNGATSARVTVVPHGIRPLRRTPIVGLGSRPVRFGYVGQISRAKGLRVLAEAFARLPAGLAQLRVTGNPQRPGEREYFDAAMRPLSDRPDVSQRDGVPHEHIGQVLEQIDVLVLPTICLEVFGLIVLEALSAGRPVIVTNCGGPAETVRHGVDGLIVPPNDVTALAGALRMLAERPALVAELTAGIRPVRSLARHVDDVEAVYAAVAREHVPTPISG